MDYETKRKNLVEKLKNKKGDSIGLSKSTSNLFRYRNKKNKEKINLNHFNKVIKIDKDNQTADVEGMTTFENFVDATLKHGFMPAVVPELKTITVGGVISGVGLESSSFRYGFVHETVIEMDILTGKGKIVTATKTNKYKDLFFGLPNTYGSMGYILRARVKLVRIKPYVKMTRMKFSDMNKFFSELDRLTKKYKNNLSIGFIEAFCFSDKEFIISIGEFVGSAPYTSNYKFMNIYYKSMRKKKIDYLTIYDYIWRFDADWIWCSHNLGMENPVLRFILGKFLLKSKAYWKIMNWNRKLGITKKLDRITQRINESIIQDVEITIDKAPLFLKWYLEEIKITPAMVGPTNVVDKKNPFSFFRLNPNKMNINIGFYDSRRTDHEPGYYNKAIERKAREFKAQKLLYSDSYYTEKEFWDIYDKKTYDKLKTKYDPNDTFKDLYEKCVKRL